VVDSDAVVAWAGDSRAYLVRGGLATQITRDHSFVEEQVQLGVITPEEAKTHRYRNVITRSLGPEASVSPDVTRFALEAGDIVLLCSDGLTGTVSDDEIAEYAMAEAPSFACHELIGLANARGGPDNITVAIIRVASPTDVGPVPPPRVSGEPPPKRRGLFRR
jgi:serine/threonine protein phosphatase PrpC